MRKNYYAVIGNSENNLVDVYTNRQVAEETAKELSSFDDGSCYTTQYYSVIRGIKNITEELNRTRSGKERFTKQDILDRAE